VLIPLQLGIVRVAERYRDSFGFAEPRFARLELFDRLGMEDVILKFDGVGRVPLSPRHRLVYQRMSESSGCIGD
jgi:hypothetical protein